MKQMISKWWLLILLGAIVLGGLGYVIAINNNDTPTAISKQKDINHVAKTYTLSTGYYTIGTDLPEGTCDLKWLDGAGSVMSYYSNINDNFGRDEDNGEIKSYKNWHAKAGDTLIIFDALQIQANYTEITNGFSGRTEDLNHPLLLGEGEYKTGKYEIGKDVKAGTYNIYGVSNCGNVTCGSLGLDSDITSSDTNYDLGDVHEIMHVELYDREMLWVTGCKIKLVPERINK